MREIKHCLLGVAIRAALMRGFADSPTTFVGKMPQKRCERITLALQRNLQTILDSNTTFMQNFRLLFFLLLSLSVSTLTAQQELAKGTLTYEITDISSDDPGVSQQMEMMKGSTMRIFLTGGQQLTKMNMMDGMVQQKMLMNMETGDMEMYMDAMGQKMKVNVPSSQQEKSDAEVDVEYFPDDRKQIAGYDAYKAVIRSEAEGKSMELTAYITEDLTFSGEVLRNTPGADQLKGLPLEYSVSQPKVAMTFTATEVSPEVDESVFEFDKSGYKEMSPEQLEQMGGGMGF